MVKKNAFKRFFDGVFGKTAGDRVFHAINYTLFLLFAIVMLYPFFYVVKESLINIRLVGGVAKEVYNFSAYKFVLSSSKIITAFGITIFVVALHTLLHLFFTFVTAYPLSKTHLKGRKFFLFFIFFTMLFSGGMIPSYILITQVLNWQDNLLVYIVPGILTGFNIIVVKNFLQGIPVSLEESAKLEGANDLIILLKIYIPLSLPIAATIGLWAGVGKWNNWMSGVLYISNPNLYMIQNVLRDMLIAASSTDPSGQNPDKTLMAMADNVKMATVVVGTLPIVLIYPFVQKYFVKGMLVGSVKG
ncbi:MAG: carbohydrate ABC transporter permease [Clostridia bacterium]|nr:carbohydrate ABC transporter permease [Clostridia bacterium]